MLAKLQFIQIHGEEQAIPGVKQNYLILRPISALTIRNKTPPYWELVWKYIVKELSCEKLLGTQVEHTYVGLKEHLTMEHTLLQRTHPDTVIKHSEVKKGCILGKRPYCFLEFIESRFRCQTVSQHFLALHKEQVNFCSSYSIRHPSR